MGLNAVLSMVIGAGLGTTGALDLTIRYSAFPRLAIRLFCAGRHKMSEKQAVVLIVDDDLSVREAVADLVRSVGLRAETFASPHEFLESEQPDVPCCLILDVRLPGRSGLEFQRALTDSGMELPIIFMSAHGDIPMSVRAIKSGAIEFFTKPLNEQQLLDAINLAIERDRARRQRTSAIAELRKRFDSLTPREREVFSFVVSGGPNKQIAAHLGLSEMTVKVHRSQVMHKMRAKSLIDLVRMADRLGLAAGDAQPPKPKH